MSELEIDISYGHVRAIPVPSPVAGQVVLAGPGRLMGWSFRENGAETFTAVEGSVVSPAASQAIVTTGPLGAGLYLLKWQVQLIGAAAAADQDNFQLRAFGLNFNGENAGAAGIYPQPDTEAQNTGAATTISVIAIAAGTVGVTYVAQISVIPVSPLQAILELRDGNQALAEIGVGQGLDQTRWLGPLGVKFMNQIMLNPVQGSMTGVIFASFHRM